MITKLPPTKTKRKPLICGNWKSNNTFIQTKTLISKILDKLKYNPKSLDIIIAPTYLHLLTLQFTKNIQDIEVAAQNCSKFQTEEDGVYNGQISASQLKDMNISWVIIGNSQTTYYLQQSFQDIKQKISSALKSDMKIIYCISGDNTKIIQQLTDISKIVRDKWNNIVIAYEQPIQFDEQNDTIQQTNTGCLSQHDIQKDPDPNFPKICQQIRNWLSKNIKQSDKNVRIIYSGNINQKNCQQLIKYSSIDGFIVGDQSRQTNFIKIVDTVANAKKLQQGDNANGILLLKDNEK